MTCAVCFTCRVLDRHGDRTKARREAGPLPACRKLGLVLGGQQKSERASGCKRDDEVKRRKWRSQ